MYQECIRVLVLYCIVQNKSWENCPGFLDSRNNSQVNYNCCVTHYQTYMYMHMHMHIVCTHTCTFVCAVLERCFGDGD